MIDAHCHLCSTYTSNTVSPVVEKFIKLGGTKVIDVTTSEADIPISQQLIAQFPKIIFACIGLHPELPTASKENQEKLMQTFSTIENSLPNLQNIVGIGETGIDLYYFNDQSDEVAILSNQEELLIRHIHLAKKLNLPLIIHARGRDTSDMTAYKECLRIIEQEKFSGKIYFHSFAGDLALATKIVDAGNVIGVNGILSYSSAKLLSDVVAYVPLESILLETDSPYLVPSNLDRTLLENKTVNEPIGIYYTAKRISTIKKIVIDDILEQTEKNTRVLFKSIL